MEAKRERVLELAHRIMMLRVELQFLETEFDQLLGTQGPAGGDDKQTGVPTGMVPPAQARELDLEQREREMTQKRETARARAREVMARREREREVEIIQHTIGQRAVAHLEAQRPAVMDVKELATRLRADVPTTRTVLWRLVKAGEVVKVDKGVYRAKMPGETVTTKPGDLVPDGDN